MNKHRDIQCGQKFRYRNRSLAKTALQKLIDETGDVGLGIYYCQHCGHLHIGHLPKKIQRLKKFASLIDLIDKAQTS